MKASGVKLAAIAASITLGLMGISTAASASLIVDATVGGAPTGVSYVNFDNLPLGATGGTSGGVGVSFTPDGQTVTGTSSTYAAPYISNSNGVLFGDSQVSGADNTRYLTTGVGTAHLMLPGMEEYVGLLWGSVDTYNTLSLYNGTTLVGTVTGTDVTASASGNQGVNGTYYVNITSTLPFNNIVASSSQYAFEFDNVAYNPTTPVPEPLALVLFGLGLVGLGALRLRKPKLLAC